MELIVEQILVYGGVGLFCGFVIWMYLRSEKKKSQRTEEKILQAKTEGLYEPVSLHPEIDLNTCIGSAACVAACPEKDILGIVNGKATIIQASQCVGHGACFHSCPVEAISLVIGTEKRGVDLPHVKQNFETNIQGIYIAGELGGMGLIKNSVEQGKQAVDSIISSKKYGTVGTLDVVIIGAGPAGISATLACKKNNLTAITLEQDTLGGTVANFPRSKIVMTAPMNLPLYGKVKLYDTNKLELLGIWQDVIVKHNIEIKENSKVESIKPLGDGTFEVMTSQGDSFKTQNVILAIGRRGSPRKLGVPGEDKTKVAYRLMEPELLENKKIIIVGGGDSAIEAALSVMEKNQIVLSYRSDAFNRIKPKNRDKIQEAIKNNQLDVQFNTNIANIDDKSVTISENSGKSTIIENDLVYIFAGGELPTNFLQKIGIEITKRFGFAIKKHKK
ncbi:MAG TPA: NAD(P)-binding domain-containing protein [Saprospiraceae bacterium]|nr:NAD(P)-binding domain-containing protein [Saprospiraceae bacterium]